MIIGHIDQVQDLEYSMAAARRGVFIEYDAWGREYYREEWGWNFVMGQDAWRVQYVKELVEAGFGASCCLPRTCASRRICARTAAGGTRTS